MAQAVAINSILHYSIRKKHDTIKY